MLYLLIASALANHPPGTIIDDALIADIPPDGFSGITDFIPALLPSAIPVDGIYQNYDGLWGQCWLGGYEIDISGIEVDLAVLDADIIPQDGYLDLDITILVSMNDASNPFQLGTSLECINDTCDGYVEPFEASVQAQVFMNVTDLDGDGNTELDVIIENTTFDYALSGDNINLDSCAIGTIEDILNFIGLSIYDLVLDLAGPELENAVGDFIPELETTIEEAFGQANINETVDLNGSELIINLSPADASIKPEGLRISFDGSVSSTTVSECVAAYDQGGSLATPGALPNIGDVPNGVNPNFQLAALTADDFLNQALYTVWRSGLLCYTVDEETFPLDTGILNLLTEDAYTDLFQETEPMVIITDPKAPPTLNMNAGSDIAIDIEGLGLGFFAELDHRQAKILTADLATDVGVDVNLDQSTGLVAVDIDIDPSRFTVEISSNEFLPGQSDSLATSVSGQLDTVLGLVDIESMLGNLSFPLPSVEGLGLLNLQIAAAGASGTDLGGFAELGVVPYTTGCADSGTEGCGGGCAAGTGSQSKGFLAALLLLGIAIRRRQSF